MDYENKTFKKYQTIKTNSYIKTNTFLFFFLSNKSKNNNWKKKEQTLKKLKLTYFKTTNKIVLKQFKNSIFKNFIALICGIILLITTHSKQFEKFENIKNILQKDFSLVSLKLNNKIYSVNEISKISFLSYKKNLFVFYQNLNKYSKINYVFCSKISK